MKIAVKVNCPICHHRHEIELSLETLLDMVEALEKCQHEGSTAPPKRGAPEKPSIRDLMDMFGMS
jgi:hypothetical protein